MKQARLLFGVYALCMGAAAREQAIGYDADPACDRPNGFTSLSSSGQANYDLGFSIGASSSGYIMAKMQTAQFQALQSFTLTPSGTKGVAQLQAAATHTFPAYVDELHGIADGAGVNRSAVWIFNMMDEIEAAMPPSLRSGQDLGWREGQCTDVHLNTDPGTVTRWLAHNEDARRFNLGLMFLLDGKLGVSGAIHSPRAGAPRSTQRGASAAGPLPVATSLNFTAFMYPGQLASGAFGYNQYGFFFSTNAVFPVTCPSSLPPRAFLHRYLLESTSPQDALDRMGRVAPSCGFSVNFGQVSSGSSGSGSSAANQAQWLYNAETSSGGAVGVTRIDGGQAGGSNVSHYYHANMYRTLDNITAPQLIDDSSVARLARLDVLPVPTPATAPASLFNLLGDTYNSTYPLWRQGNSPDCCATIITATFQVEPASASAGHLEGVQAGNNAAAAGETGIFTLYANNPKLCAGSDGPVLVRRFP